MAKYDGLIIPRSYSEYINKTDAATHAQAHQLSGVLDPAPVENGANAVKSGGVYTALAGKQPTLTFDNVPTEDSDNPVKSGGIYDALQTKQDALTFDNTPTADSDNPVKSGGILETLKESVNIDLLWENPAPTSTFAAQTITAESMGKDLTKYQAIIIYIKNVRTGSNYTTDIVLKDMSTIITGLAAKISARDLTFTDSGITFGTGWVYATYGSGSTNDNDSVIPVKIYGIKKV